MCAILCGWSSWSYGVMVSTLDFESSDPGSNPGRTSFLSARRVSLRYVACARHDWLIVKVDAALAPKGVHTQVTTESRRAAQWRVSWEGEGE